MGLPAAAVCAQVAIPCYNWVFRMCGPIVANTGRTCSYGGSTFLCGDVILDDETVSDVKASSTGQVDPVQGATVTVQIQEFKCDNATQSCIPDGPPIYKTCTGREPDGDTCGAQSID